MDFPWIVHMEVGVPGRVSDVDLSKNKGDLAKKIEI